jgi:hypothetical protein
MKRITNVLLAGSVLGLAVLTSERAPGDVDLSFDPGSSLENSIMALVVQTDGRILLRGGFTSVHGELHPPAQLYFDTSTIGQPPRLYRLVPMP